MNFTNFYRLVFCPKRFPDTPKPYTTCMGSCKVIVVTTRTAHSFHDLIYILDSRNTKISNFKKLR